MFASRIEWAKDDLPETVVVPSGMAEDREKVKKWLEDTWECPCKDFRLGESVYYTESEKTAIHARVRVLLDQISKNPIVIDSFNDEVCDWVAESIMVNNAEAVLSEKITEEWVIMELLNLLIFKTS